MQRKAAVVLSVVMWATFLAMISFLNAEFAGQANGWRAHLLPTAFGAVLGFLVAVRRERQEETQATLHRSLAALGERIKELNCLYGLSNLAERRHLPLEDIFQQTVNLIPPALQHPDMAWARVRMGDQVFTTANFRETPLQVQKEIRVHDRSAGDLTVGYLQESRGNAGSPFLAEEDRLLQAVAERLGKIAERRQDRTRLQESEALFRDLFDSMSNGAAILEAVSEGRDFIFKDLNQAGERIDKVDKKDVLGKSLQEVFPAIEQTGLPETMRQVWRSGKPEQLPPRMYADERIEGWRQYSVYRLSTGEVVCMCQDVTEQKDAEQALQASERRFRTLVENAPLAISIIQDGQVVYQNIEQERIFGPLPRSTALVDYARIHPEDQEKVRRISEEIAAGKIGGLELDLRYAPDGNLEDPIWLHCRGNTVEYRRRPSLLVSMVDLTRTKKLEQLLVVQDKMASLGRVAAGIAHEIRNPLSGINIYINTLEKFVRRGESEEKITPVFRHLQSASRKIESVIRRVMDFSRPGEPHLLSGGVNRPIEEALSLTAVALRKANVKVEKNLSADLPSCRIDAQQLEEVLLNLINNAADAMRGRQGSKIIRVRSHRRDNAVIICVADSGPGIPAQEKDKVFDPFYTTKSDSTGIGLSICRRIIADHGGSIRIRPSKWGGAEFRITLPAETQQVPQ